MRSYIKKGFASFEIIGVIALVLALGVTLVAFNNYENPNVRADQETKLSVFSAIQDSDTANEDGNSFTTSNDIWFGVGQSQSNSYLGLVLSGDSIPQGAKVNKAELKFTQKQEAWISLGFEVKAIDSSDPQTFSDSSKPSSRATVGSQSFSDNVKWESGKTYSYDVTSVVQEYVNKYSSPKIGLILKGTGGQWGRKFVQSPRLEVQYTVGVGVGTNPTPTVTPTVPTGISGDCNADGKLDAGDQSALSLEIEDGDGSGAQNAWGGGFQGTPDCDANKDGFINQADFSCLNTLIFGGSCNATARPTITPTPTPAPTKTPTPRPTATPVPATPTPVPTATSEGGGTGTGGAGTPSGSIYGAVPDNALGTCTHAVHDKYVTRGPNGQLYRTWHPVQDPSGCRFAHEHGDDPSISNIYQGPIPFSYIGSNIDIDMPHVGYKCFVHNKGTRNDEGTVALHDSYYCFHMGTAGVGRYTARFHELYFFMTTAGGYKMNIQGLADTGGLAGSICDIPRAGRTVQTLDCKLDSAYEIWANDLIITNKGNRVASIQASTAVFDPITTMDRNDRNRVLYTWDPIVAQSTFRFNNSRDHFRGCDREAYSGPAGFYNNGGSTVYYTDVYGNVVNGGPLRQEISAINTNANAPYLTPFGALLMGNKGNEPQSQFKFRRSACAPGLGINN